MCVRGFRKWRFITLLESSLDRIIRGSLPLPISRNYRSTADAAWCGLQRRYPLTRDNLDEQPNKIRQAFGWENGRYHWDWYQHDTQLQVQFLDVYPIALYLHPKEYG